MNVGFDYWQVLSHFPDKFEYIVHSLSWTRGVRCHVVSAVGKDRAGTVEAAVRALGETYAHIEVHEVVFDDPKQSPELKLAKCQELGIQIFFDDRDDVCRLLNKHGILALRVTRKDNSTYDLGAERS